MAKIEVNEVKLIINDRETYKFLATKEDIRRMTKMARKEDSENLIFAIAQAPKNSNFYKTNENYIKNQF